MSALLRDVRFGLRLLQRNPGFATVAVLTLALGISATTAIFSVVYGTFFAPLPYRQADRLVVVWEQDHGSRQLVSPRDYLEWKRRATEFSSINAWGGRSLNLATDERPESVQAGVATPGFLGMLGYGHPLSLGRSFVDDEGVPGRDKVIILTHQLWQERFGGDPDIVGRQVRVDGEPHTVVGVLGEGPADHQQDKAWIPLALTEADRTSNDNSLYVMARLKDGVTVAEADASMRTLSAALERERPEPREGWSVSVEPFRNDFVQDSTKRGIWLLLGAVTFLLLIACANVANLLLARGAARRRELAIRTSMGATRRAIARQLLIESLIVALLGGALGALLASGIVQAIVALMPEFTLPSETEITLSIPVLLFALAACTLAGLLAGCAPAWQAARLNVAEVMKEGGRGVAAGRHGLRRALVVVEFALALTLLVGGGLTVAALVRTMRTDLGFRSERLLTFLVPVGRDRLTTADEMESFYRRLMERTAALPGVSAVSVSTGMPIEGVRFGENFEIASRRVGDPRRRPGVGINMVTPDYHRAFGITMLRGRAFTDRDRAGSLRVAIVNEAFVRRYLPGTDPIGERLLFTPFVAGPEASSEPVEWEVVGMHRDAANAGPGREVYPEVEIPFWQDPWPRAIVAVYTPAATTDVRAGVADVVRRLDPDLPITDVRTIQQTISESVAADRFYTVFFTAFAGLALALAAIGIYGVMSYSVAQRTHEIGLRMALGARGSQVLGQVLREGLLTALAGTALGALGGLAVWRGLAGAVYGVERRARSPLRQSP